MEQQAVDLQKAQADAQVTNCTCSAFFLSFFMRKRVLPVIVKGEDGALSRSSYFEGNSSTL